MIVTPMSSEQRQLLASILDCLIPSRPERDIPGAGEAGVADDLARVAAETPEFSALLVRLLARASDLATKMTPETVHELEKALPGEFMMLLTETYKRYYARGSLRPHFGVGAHPVHPAGYAVERESSELLDRLTEPVRKRGSFYRDPTAVENG